MIENLINYTDVNDLDMLFVQYNDVTFKEDFYNIKCGTKLAWFACNFNTGEYFFAYHSDDGPHKWFKGKIEITFGKPT